MNHKNMKYVKGAAVGLIVGTTVTMISASNHKRNLTKAKKNASKAVKAFGGAIEDVKGFISVK